MSNDPAVQIDPRLAREAHPSCEQTNCPDQATHAAIATAIHDPNQRPIAYLVCRRHALIAYWHHETCPDCPETYTLRIETL